MQLVEKEKHDLPLNSVKHIKYFDKKQLYEHLFDLFSNI